MSNNTYVPPFTYFNKRDITTLVSMLLPLLFVVSVAIYFNEFVWHAISVNLAVNLGIICTAAFGVTLILLRLLAVQRDFRIIERFGYEAKQGTYMKTLLDEPWLRGRYVRHYLSHIANTGGTLSSQLEQSAIESELHALQTDYDSRLELPQFLVGFMIAMGLLGTFIGLLETLTGISSMLDGMSNEAGGDIQKEFLKLVVALHQPLAGMGIAFSASMFGLITSLMLAIMMTNLRRFVSRTISLARNVMHELTEMTRESRTGNVTSLSPNDIDSLLAAEEEQNAPAPAPSMPMSLPPLTPQSTQASDEMFSGNRGGVGLDPAMAGRFEVMTKKMELLLEAFEANSEHTRKLNDLLGYGPRMKETSEKMLEEIRTIAANAAEAREAGIGNGRHLNEIKENFTKLCKSGAMVDLIANNIGSQTALLEALVEETRRTQQGLAIINKSIVDRK